MSGHERGRPAPGHGVPEGTVRLSADLGSVRVDLTEAEFDERVIDLHVYTGWGSITIIVPVGVAVQVIHHRGGVASRLEPPLPGLPLIRLDVTTNIGKVRLRHPGPPGRKRRRPRSA